MTKIEKELYEKYFDFNRDLNKPKKPFNRKKFIKTAKGVGKILEEEGKYDKDISRHLN